MKTQKELIRYYNENGGLRCKGWSCKEVKNHIKADFGSSQRVYNSTCLQLIREAEIMQR
jgi:hypothetical protein